MSPDLRRRLCTVPALLGAAALAPLVFPAVAAGCALVDLLSDRRMPRLRMAVAFAALLELQAATYLAGCGLWLCRQIAGDEHDLAAHRAVMSWWARTVRVLLCGVMGVRFQVEGQDTLARGPFLLFSRHASVADTVLPLLLATVPHGLWPRYAIKRELRIDPAMDLMAPRLRAVFVDRSGLRTDDEVERVGSLADDLEPGEFVALFPEGTRFSARRRARRLAQLAFERDQARLEYASSLHATLAPHHGGPLALLDHGPGVDVVFCAHSGLEDAHKLHHLAAGRLVGATVDVCLWRVPAKDLPTDPAGRKAWLDAWWQRIDAWVAEHQASNPARSLQRRPAWHKRSRTRKYATTTSPT